MLKYLNNKDSGKFGVCMAETLKELFIGIDHKRYKKIHPEMKEANWMVLVLVSILAVVSMTVLGFVSKSGGQNPLYYSIYFIFAALIAFNFLVAFVVNRLHLEKRNVNSFLFMILLLTFGLFIGIFDAPDSSSTVFVVLLLACPLLFTMKPLYVNLLSILMTIAFVVAEYYFKTPEVFRLDATNAVSFCFLGILTSSFMMRTKILKLVAECEKRELMDVIQKESVTDKMTGLLNRSAYEVNFKKYPVVPKGRDFVYVSIDLNGLKVANDTLGHSAGDELIKGCADLMRDNFSKYGNLYRTGGDEFVAVLFVDNELFETLHQNFLRSVDEWQGEIVEEISVAIGWASIADYPDKNVDELSKIADKYMYADKGRYYKTHTANRRGRQEAHVVLVGLYTKILKIDLMEDAYQIISMDESEKKAESGFSESFSAWLNDFANSEYLHKDDTLEFLEKTNIEHMRKLFLEGVTCVNVFYRRLIRGEYRKVMTVIVPCDTFSVHNQQCFLYVKDIDN